MPEMESASQSQAQPQVQPQAQPQAQPQMAQQAMLGQQPLYQQPVYINKVVSSRGWYITKIVFGAFIITSDIIIFGVGGGLASAYYDWNGLLYILIVFPVAFVSLCWQISEFITLCVHRNRGIHPGAHVGMHLVLWLGFAGTAGVMTTLAVYDQSDFDSGYYDDFYDNVPSDFGSYLSLAFALVAWTYILL